MPGVRKEWEGMTDLGKTMNREYNRAYYRLNREKHLAACHRYYEENKERIRAQQVEYTARRYKEGWSNTKACQKCRNGNKARLGESQRWIREKRKELGYSQKALAKLLGVSYSHISLLENGFSPLSSFYKRKELLRILEVNE